MTAPLGPSYRRLWTASAMSNLADGVFQVALPLLALRITRSPAQVAAVAFAGRLPWLVFALPAGALADRLDRRWTMIRVDAARVVLLSALTVTVAAGHERLWVLYVVAFALGMGETLFDTAAQSVMPAVVEADQLSRANGRLYAVELTLNQFVGPPLGGVLAGAAIAAAFGVSAGAYAIAALTLLAMRGSFRPARTGAPTRLRTDIVEGLRYLARHRLLRTLGFMVGMMNLTAMATLAVFPLYAVEPGPLGLSESGFGAFLAAGAVGALAGTFIADRLERRLGRARTLLLSVAGEAIGQAILLTTSVPLILVVMTLAGAMTISWNIITVSLRQRIVPDHLLGRVNAGYRLLAWGTMPLGALAGGIVAELLSIRWVFALSALAHVGLVWCFRIVTDAAMDAVDSGRAAASAAPTEPDLEPEPAA